MRRLVTAFYIAAFSSVNAGEARVVEYWCAVMSTSESGIRTDPTPGLSIISYNAKTQFRGLQADGARVTAVLCERSSIVPQPYDYQVILVGYPFYIRAADRTAVLERRDGLYKLRILKD